MVPLILKTDYSLLQSLITVQSLISFLKKNNISTCAITDNNLNGSIEFYFACKSSNIKPIIGLELIFQENIFYLYAKNFEGYKNLLKINSMIQDKALTEEDLINYKDNLVVVLPYASHVIFQTLKTIYTGVFIAFNSLDEKELSRELSPNILYANLVLALDKDEILYLNYLDMIRENTTISIYEKRPYSSNYFNLNQNEDELNSKFISLFDLELPTNNRYIPKYDKDINSFDYLRSLVIKGLEKRLGQTPSILYMERLKKEINIIKNMGFIDYFLIVYDYIKYAKKNNILVGAGRGSVAGSLVAWALGITDVNPIKYNLLFERFLNPERKTMPDIDVDFEWTRRDEVVSYVIKKYGSSNVAPIITYATLKSKQVLRDVLKILEIDEREGEQLLKLINPHLSLSDNLKNKVIIELIKMNSNLKKVFLIALELENLKRQTSTHAAGVVISSLALDEIIPIYKNGSNFLTGITMEYLEPLGLLKMDFLSLGNLSIIQNILTLINNSKERLELSQIPLNDEKTLELFRKADTKGIFQFESQGMTNFLKHLAPTTFEDIIASLALFRPGPMDNINSFIDRKYGREKIDYFHDDLKPILEETYGIIVYQEQIMQILAKMASYSYAEADNIRRAMSKKKKELIEAEKERFIERSIKNNYGKETSEKVYNLILKFAGYGFNKAHSVSYALIGFQMAYLKVHYPLAFVVAVLNLNIGNEEKTKEYLELAKEYGIKLFKPHINYSSNEYQIKESSIIMPLSMIKNVGQVATKKIIEERVHGEYSSFLNFVARVYGQGISRKTIEVLIDADAFRGLGLNRKTLYENIDNCITYSELIKGAIPELISPPILEESEEYESSIIMAKELETFGFYITNHPASKYKEGITKINTFKDNFNKNIKTVIIVAKIKKVKTKKGEDMFFVSGSDETGVADFVIFPKLSVLASKIKAGSLIAVWGLITKRIDKYQVNVTSIENILL